MVIQGAQGRIVARVQRQYTASRPLTVRTSAYTGRSTERTTLYLPGYTRTEETGALLRSAETQTEWQPLRLGRLALPGCLCRVTSRERAVQTLTYPEGTAAAMIQHFLRSVTKSPVKFCAIFTVSFAENCDII